MRNAACGRSSSASSRIPSSRCASRSLGRLSSGLRLMQPLETTCQYIIAMKKMYDLSDEALIQNAAVNMAYKYFLDLDPEDGMIDSSLLTKFRKTRITEDILEEMLKETIAQAIQKGLIKSSAIIVDSTHTNAAARPASPTQVLRSLSKQLRKEIYKRMYNLSVKFPEKPSETADLQEEMEYTHQLLENIGEDIFHL